MAITASDGALTVFTIGICVSCIIGVLISFPALLPLLRNLGHHDKTLRIAEIVIFGLLSFTLTFGLWTRMSVYWTRAVSGGIDRAGFNELWIRRMIPPPLRRSCYTSQATVCRTAAPTIPPDRPSRPGHNPEWVGQDPNESGRLPSPGATAQTLPRRDV